jgi:hypothetical protein
MFWSATLVFVTQHKNVVPSKEEIEVKFEDIRMLNTRTFGKFEILVSSKQ